MGSLPALIYPSSVKLTFENRMASASSSSPMPSLDANLESSLELHRKKRRKTEEATTSSHRDAVIDRRLKRWRTDREQRIYSFKLIEALRRSLRTPSGALCGGGREVHNTADRVLAVSARGITRWSRAIISRRIGGTRLKKLKKAKVTGDFRLRKPPQPEIRKESRRLPALGRKVKILGQLVPGCRKLPLPSLLDEAGDYIAALQMQVRAMTALADMLSAVGSGPQPPVDRGDSNVS